MKNILGAVLLSAVLAAPVLSQTVELAGGEDSVYSDDLAGGRRKILAQKLIMHLLTLSESTIQHVASENYGAAKKDFSAMLCDKNVQGEKRAQLTGQRGLMELAAGDLAGAVPDLNAGIKSLEGKLLDGRPLGAGERVLLSSMLMMRGHLQIQQGRLEEAMRDEDEAIAADPKGGIPHILRGRILLKSGLTDQAVAEFEKAAKLDPTIPVKKKNVCVEFAAAGATPPSCVAAR